MKTLTILSIAFALFVTNTYSQDHNHKTETKGKSATEVYAIHDLEIKPGVDSKEFEAFVMNELGPIYDKMEGQKMILVKGDRGMRTGKYSVILIFDSVEDRDRIYPPSGELVGDFGKEETWSKFQSMVTVTLGQAHTDYIMVGH